mmetsp:Transcript_29903/g.41758  ORF Transcript_29903/g.41758 Transcript_29903/m.41758 type:complete len:122 (-) Transcript_29903:195-560(-)
MFISLWQGAADEAGPREHLRTTAYCPSAHYSTQKFCILHCTNPCFPAQDWQGLQRRDRQRWDPARAGGGAEAGQTEECSHFWQTLGLRQKVEKLTFKSSNHFTALTDVPILTVYNNGRGAF